MNADSTEEKLKSLARVVRVLSPRRVAIDRGTASVNVGDRFVIFSLTSEEILHPGTGESLGKLEIFKGTGEVVHTQPRMSIIESDRIPGRTIVRKNPDWVFTNPFRQGVEEIRDQPALPFEDPEVGDYARQIW